MYEAIAEPKEGTMITVIRKWAETVAARREEPESFLKVLTRAQARAVQALQETKHRLEAMRRANVVDAGSKGMVLFLEGMIDFLSKPSHKKIVSVRRAAAAIETASEVPAGPVRLRYCTEGLIRPRPGLGGAGLDRERLKAEIAGFGDSLVIAGSPDVLRFHIHTDTPALLFHKIRGTGDLVFQKADDMLRQYEAAHARKWPIALVTDSTCDLPPEVLDRYQVHVVPMQLNLGGACYLDKVTIAPDQFYARLDECRDYPTTSQPTPQAFESLFASLAGSYDSIIAIHLSQKLSGTYSTSVAAARRVSERTGKTITVIDSRTISGALGLVVLEAARRIEDGRPHEEAVQAAERIAPRTKLLVGVRTLKFMVRSGRVSPMAGAAAKALNLKPIVTLGANGETRIFDKAFSQRGLLKKILRQIGSGRGEGPSGEYYLLHAHCPNEAAAFAADVEAVLGRKPAAVMDISPAIGLHAGVGALALAFLAND